jgi:phospholipase C
VAGALALASCGDSGGASAARTPTATATATSTATASATASASVTPTASATPSPSPTPTPINPEELPLPDPASSGIQHVVVVMMENRSFDHFLGWLPGADGMQAGLSFTDKQGNVRQTFPLAPNFQNCQFADPDHSYEGGRAQFNGGANDGWLKAGTDDLFPLGYYVQDDLSLYGQAVPAWTTFDRYFAAILGPTYPNRFYMHAAQTDRLTNTLTISTLPTIWDRIAQQGLTGTYYYSDLPFLVLFGQRYTPIIKPIAQFFEDASAGTLPNLTYIDPRFIGESTGTSNDDHPLADIRNGQAFLSQIYNALTTSPNWPDTVLVINYDEWGGFFDHVPPPLAPLTVADATTGNDGRLGFRVPCIVTSPLARRGFIGHKVYDHTSVLAMIEWRWGLAPLSARDASANNLAHALDFTQPKNLQVPAFSVPQGPFGTPCTTSPSVARPELEALRPMAQRYGIPVPPAPR